jgi:hypothetical protein
VIPPKLDKPGIADAAGIFTLILNKAAILESKLLDESGSCCCCCWVESLIVVVDDGDDEEVTTFVMNMLTFDKTF